jgi:hypothetical protein
VLRTTQGNGRRPLWMWFAGVAVFALLILTAVAVLVIRPRLATWARAYVIRSLERRYDAKVELHNLEFSLYPHVRATGSGLIVRRVGQEQLPPFMTIRSWCPGMSNRSGWRV